MIIDKTEDTLLKLLEAGGADGRLAQVYAPNGDTAALGKARKRAIELAGAFYARYPAHRGRAALFSSPGRTELGGNHTDHQRGHVLCASVNVDMLCCAAPNGENIVRISSQGYPDLEIELEDLCVRAEQRNTSAALVRGVAAGIAGLGCRVGGFDACLISDVLSGSGLSSSAAYEVLVGNIVSHFFCADALDPIALAKIGQYAENQYFGKPCGLMDQVGCSVGGAVAIDFSDPAEPVVQRISYDFDQSGHTLCIVDTGSCHADLTSDYAQIPREMGAVAAYFGKDVLSQVPEEEFFSAIPTLRQMCGDRAVLRALHFYGDDRRAQQERQALQNGDFFRFLQLVNQSGQSSETLLQNAWSPADPQQQAIPLALAVGRRLLAGEGAIRVHGGGFAGTIQAFVPNAGAERFRAGMEDIFGQKRCHMLRIRPQGGCVVIGMGAHHNTKLQ